MTTRASLFVGSLTDHLERPVEIPYVSASFTERLSADIGWSATLPSAPLRRMGVDVRPWRAAVFLRAGSYVTGGIVTAARQWSRDDGTDGGRVTIAGGGWMAYLARRHVYNVDRTYTATEQFDIVADVLTWAQTNAVASPAGDGDIGLQLQREPTNSGVTRDRTYRAGDVKQIRELIEELGAVDGGFDWMPACTWVAADAPTRLLRLGYPRLGLESAVRPAVADGAGVTVDREDYAGEAVVTRAHATGQADDRISVNRPVLTNTASDRGGLPILETVESHDTTANPSTLAGHAQRAVDAGDADRSVTMSVLDVDRYALEQMRPGDQVDAAGDHPGMSSALGEQQPWRILSRAIAANVDGLVTVSIELAAAATVATPGPKVIRPADRARWQAVKEQRAAERLRQRVGRADT